jgi:hypothetical protein
MSSSPFSNGFSYGWRLGAAHSTLEAERRAILAQPLPPNPKELFTPTKVRVIKAFGIGGGRVAVPGTVIDLPRHDALSMCALRRVVIV